MTLNVGLHRASRLDIDALVGLMEAYYEHEGMTFHASVAHAAMFRLLSDESLGSAWLINADGMIAGYLVLTFGYSLEYGGRYATVDEFFLYEPYRGRGIGTETLEIVEEYCRSSDLRALELESMRGNWKAKEFYERLGYSDQGRYLLVKRIED
jgi:GNAT superfamily N-acetyltransferase